MNARSIIDEYYRAEVGDVKRGINLSNDEKIVDAAYNYSWKLETWLENVMGYDPASKQDWIEDISAFQHEDPDLFKTFGQWVINTSISTDYHDPVWTHFDRADTVKPQWLVHWTKESPRYVAKQGFIYGHPDLCGLGLTCYKRDRKQQPGYNFAFDLRDASKGHNKYGDEAVMFFAGGVEAFHYGDAEYQVIFWGPDAKHRIPIYAASNGEWTVVNKHTERVVYHNENFDAVTQWVEDNFQRYASVIAYD